MLHSFVDVHHRYSASLNNGNYNYSYYGSKVHVIMFIFDKAASCICMLTISLLGYKQWSI